MLRLTHRAPLTALFLLLAGALLLSQGLIGRVYVHDLFFVSDSIWRSSLGEVPHVSFESPIGQAFYWPYAVVGGLFGASIMNVLWANLLVGAFIFALALLTLPSRFPPLATFLAGALLITAAMTGRSVDELPLAYDYLAPYNRWSWCFATLAAFIVAVPRQQPDGRRRTLIDGLCLGLLLAILYYSKISFFAATAGMVVAALLLGSLKPRIALIAFAASAAAALAVEAAFGNNLQYLQDLSRAASVNVNEGRGVFRVVRTAFSVAVGALFGIGALAIFFAAARTGSLRSWLALWWRPIAIVAVVIGAAILIRAQNHAKWEVGMFGAALIIAAELARRVRAGRGETYVPGAWRRALVAFILFGGAALVPLLDGASILAHAVESRMAASCASPVLRGTPMAALLFPKPNLLAEGGEGGGRCSDLLTARFVPNEAPSSNEAEYRRMLRTVTELRRVARPNDVVLALEFANPYPMILRSPPPEGALIWFDYGRSFSSTTHPDPRTLLSRTDIVVQTDYPYEPLPSLGTGFIGRFRMSLRSAADNALGPGQDAWMVYGAEVQRQFTPVAQAGDARIWARKDRGAAPAAAPQAAGPRQ